MIDKNDPRLTAYVLGELDEKERAIVEQAIAQSPELSQAVTEIQRTTAWLSDEFAAEELLGLGTDRKEELSMASNATAVTSKEAGTWKSFVLRNWAWAAAAACLLALAVPMSQQFNPPNQVVTVETESIVVAADNVPAWSELGPNAVKEEEWPKDKIPPDAARSIEEFEGKQSLYPLHPGEPIILSKLTDGSGQYASGRIPDPHHLEHHGNKTYLVPGPAPESPFAAGTPPIKNPPSDWTLYSERSEDGNEEQQNSYFDQVKDLVTSTVANSEWDDAGGPGSIEAFEGDLSLVISNTQTVHEQPDVGIDHFESFASESFGNGRMGGRMGGGMNLADEQGQQDGARMEILAREGALGTYALQDGAEEVASTDAEFGDYRQNWRLLSANEIQLERQSDFSASPTSGDRQSMPQLSKLQGRRRGVDRDRATQLESKLAEVDALAVVQDRAKPVRQVNKALADELADTPVAKKPAAKTWRRVKAAPNTSRLMIGDNEELDMNGMQVHVQVDGFRARVLVDYFYHNDHDRQLEGKFKIRLPDDASLYYFAFGQSAFDLTQNGELPNREFMETTDGTQFVSLRADDIKRERQDVWRNVKEARMAPKEKAAFAYSQTVRRRVDPALVEWSGAGVFNANVFPLMPKKLHRIVIGYDVNLTQTADGLTYKLDLPEQMGKCKVELNVRDLPGTTVMCSTSATVKEKETNKGRRFRINKPEAGESIRLTIAGDTNVLLRSGDKKEGDFFATRVNLDLPKDAAAGASRAVFLVDTSLSSRPDKFNVWLDLLRATLDNNRDSLDEFAVLFFNVENHFWKEEFVANTPENVRQLTNDCQQLVLEGATDLYSAVDTLRDSDWVVDSTSPDLFLLSDGAANWGETNLRLIDQVIDEAELGSLFAYQTGLTGTAVANLRFLASETGGAVFSVASEDEVGAASTAHRARPWKLKSISFDGATDLLTAGRVQWVYPGQPITVVGRLKQGNDPADINFVLERGDEEKTVRVQSDSMLESELASRLYGQVAVGQLESLGESVFDVSAAYSRHFRITGRTCSLLMLESEADYERFNILPQEDLFVVKSKNAGDLVASTLEGRQSELADPKTQMMTWLGRLQNMPGMKFKMPTALKLAIEDIQFDAISDSLNCEVTGTDGLSKEYLSMLSAERLNYDAIAKEASRRGEESVDDAVKVLSSLIEQNTGDLVLARDVAFSAMEMSCPAHAYHLLRRIAHARPYDPSIYTSLGQCLTQMNKADMAVIFYEIALGSEFQNRQDEFRKIAGTEYAYLLREIVGDRKASNIKSYAEARLETLGVKLPIEKSADLLITMTWNTDQSDVDLHVVEPSGEECFYSHPNTRSGGHLTRDITDGFGPEMYTIHKAPRGVYDIQVKYFDTNQNRTGMRSKVYLTIYRDFGTGGESVIRKVVNITKLGQKERVERLIVK